MVISTAKETSHINQPQASLLMSSGILIFFVAALLASGSSVASPGFVSPVSRSLSGDPPQDSGFEALATYQGLGRIEDAMVGPGATGEKEYYYLSYAYAETMLDIVSIDPETGHFHVYKDPAKGEDRATMTVGPDGNIYIGTCTHAHMMRFDPRTDTITDLGRPSQTEEYIWQLALGADNKIYGGTYPSAKLVRFDPVTAESEDLGRMDPTEMYARWVAASDDGFIYIGTGYVKAHIVAFEIRTGQHRDILPNSYHSTAVSELHRGNDGKVYARLDGGQCFRLEGWSAVPVLPAQFTNREPRNRLKDGRLVNIEGNKVRVEDPRTKRAVEFPFVYGGETVPIFRVTSGPDGMLYASTILPVHFLRINPLDGQLEELGELGAGEIYSILSLGGQLYMGAYGGLAPLMTYNPARPFNTGAGSVANPVLLHYLSENEAWRPEAMIAGPQGKIYLGAMPGYGQLGGPLTVWDPVENRVETFPQLIPDQSVVSLTRVGQTIVGGTNVRGGLGTRATQRDARVFVWDPLTRQKIFDTIPVPGAAEINDLIAVPDGRVYGIADFRWLFVFDPGRRKVTYRSPLPFSLPQGQLYNCVGIGPDKRIWGLTRDGVFALDPLTNRVDLVAKSPEPITAGFAMDREAVYFAAGPTIYRFRLP